MPEPNPPTIDASQGNQGIKRECTCKVATHEHGTRTMYLVDKCRCDECREANRREQWERERARLYGRYDSGRVDAAPVRDHVQFLVAQGISYKQLAIVSGVSASAIGALLYGRKERGHAPYKRVSAETASAILAVKPTLDNMNDGAKTSVVGSSRRLQALVRIGWSQAKLCDRLGITPANGSRLFAGRGRVSVRRAKDVRGLYEELWDRTPQPKDWREKIAVNRSVNRASDLGWLPPMAWDDDTIDDPETMPIPEVRDDFIHARERFADIEFLLETGCGLGEVIRRSGYKSVRSLERACHRYDRGDLVARVKNIANMERAA